jgi:hypothetical protein
LKPAKTWIDLGWYEISNGRGWRNILATAAEVKLQMFWLVPGFYRLIHRRRINEEYRITAGWLVVVNERGRTFRRRMQ